MTRKLKMLLYVVLITVFKQQSGDEVIVIKVCNESLSFVFYEVNFMIFKDQEATALMLLRITCLMMLIFKEN